jgi:hypothetical protein
MTQELGGLVIESVREEDLERVERLLRIGKSEGIDRWNILGVADKFNRESAHEAKKSMEELRSSR